MTANQVIFFRPYPFEPGQKIRIEGGNRAGDWEVTAVADKTVTLRCPISGRQFEWPRFCYYVNQQEDVPWPLKDQAP